MKFYFLDDIEWPDENDWPVQSEAKDIITALLHQSPRDRLGTGGSHEVKEHPYFYGVNWNSLLRQKAEFVPQLVNDEDTSYFDSKYQRYCDIIRIFYSICEYLKSMLNSYNNDLIFCFISIIEIHYNISARMDRYNHDLGDDTDDTDDSPLFGSFSSYSPQSRKISQTRPPQFNSDIESDASKKQLFRTELECTIAQLSLGSIASSVTPPSKLADPQSAPSEKHRPPSSSVKNSSCAENQNKTDKFNATSSSSVTPNATISMGNEPQLSVVKSTQAERMSINLSTPDSSQTESDDISPQIQRKRHAHSRDKLPRFSISVDDEHM